MAAGAAALAVACSAATAPIPEGGVTVQEVARALQAQGYKAEIGRDRVGDPMITSALDGSNFRVLFYDCEAGRCAAIQFATAFDVKDGLTLSRINTWNRERRFGRAYLDDEMDPFVEYDVDFEVGATTEAVGNAIDVWEAVVPAFKKHIDTD
ncbi:YbjN domain-containing protein [Phenylobacterium sp.]|jgi:hypothetical protein|uniref:YbjN domain-containing protein n=1 Tax=Phenylobacterium sp. TaxID=1871053 RepID=UPI002E36F5E1|nr:YbjN domain-containing protein [Phenylobacterium sp.]HEX2560555.1 YbjN domain-containing protein [Phenylobacterium sp.]